MEPVLWEPFGRSATGTLDYPIRLQTGQKRLHHVICGSGVGPLGAPVTGGALLGAIERPVDFTPSCARFPRRVLLLTAGPEVFR